MHIGIIGGSGSGKTFALEKLIPAMAAKCDGRLPLFCSTLGIDSEKCHKFSDETAEEFIRAAFTAENTGRFVIVDEAPDTIGRGNKAKPFAKLPRKGRHPNNLCVFAFQDFTGIEPIFRSQNTTWLIFRLNMAKDAQTLAGQLGFPLIERATELETGNFIFANKAANICKVMRLKS